MKVVTIYFIINSRWIISHMLLVRKNMDVNEQKRLFNITLKHNLKSRNNTFIVVQHFTVTVGSAIMNITSHLKIIVQRPLACNWSVLLTSVDTRYIGESLTFWCHLVYIYHKREAINQALCLLFLNQSR